MRIATYNFLHGGSARRNGHLTRLVEATNPDVVLCQEARPVGAASDGEQLVWRAVPGYRWGSGILLRNHSGRRVSVPGFEGWVTGVEIKIPDRLRIFSVHCPAGAGGYVKTMHRILDAITPLARKVEIVIGGDFNVAAGYRTEGEAVRMSRGERELLDRITGEFQLSACWQEMNAGRPLAQTLRWTANRTAPYHCDGIFIPKAWRSRLQSCVILDSPEWHTMSDHNPVVADLSA
jgi:exonuclease III